MIYENDDFKYDSETGKLCWNRDIVVGGGAVRITKGTLCSQTPDSGGYLAVQHKGKQYLQHRVIWFLVYGYWPKGMDHISGDRTNNKLRNLREASQGENNKNKKISILNTSGHTGVHWALTSGKWRAQIKVNDKGIHLGFFDELEDAVAAREAANLKYGFHKNHGRQQ